MRAANAIIWMPITNKCCTTIPVHTLYARLWRAGGMDYKGNEIGTCLKFMTEQFA
jgi:hypothetical protein